MRFYDVLGFVDTVETAPGVLSEVATERKYRGNVFIDSRRYQGGEKINEDLNLSNRISVVADDYILSNAAVLRYVKWRGLYWKVTYIEISHPRIILTLGGIYNGKSEDKTSGDTGEFYWNG